MNLNWEEDRRRQRQHVLARWGLGILVVVLIGIPVGIALTNRGSTSASLSSLPGFQSGDQAADTTPFDLVLPTADGSTTIPGGPLGNDDDEVTDWPAPAPTTTLKPPPEVAADDAACQAMYQITLLLRSGNDLQNRPTEFAGTASVRIEEAARLLRQADATRFADMIRILDADVEGLTRATTQTEILALLGPLMQWSTPEIQAAAAPLLQHAQTSCAYFKAPTPLAYE